MTEGVQTIVIRRDDLQIKVVTDDTLLSSVTRINEGAIMGVIGIMNVQGLNFLAVISGCEVVGQLSKVNINKVATVRLLAFQEGALDFKVVEMLNAAKQMLEDGFYFSYGYDVTCSRQRRVKWMQSQNKDAAGLIACDDNYFWNHALYADFIKSKVDPKWFTPLMQGYFGQVKDVINGRSVSVTLLTRRMHRKSGSQKINRGIDDLGFVGN